MRYQSTVYALYDRKTGKQDVMSYCLHERQQMVAYITSQREHGKALYAKREVIEQQEQRRKF